MDLALSSASAPPWETEPSTHAATSPEQTSVTEGGATTTTTSSSAIPRSVVDSEANSDEEQSWEVVSEQPLTWADLERLTAVPPLPHGGGGGGSRRTTAGRWVLGAAWTATTQVGDATRWLVRHEWLLRNGWLLYTAHPGQPHWWWAQGGWLLVRLVFTPPVASSM